MSADPSDVSGERALIAAVLLCALEDAVAGGHRKDARAWIFGEERRVFSFGWCTWVLGVDPDRARARLRERLE